LNRWRIVPAALRAGNKCDRECEAFSKKETPIQNFKSQI
jgi:hypothetical protein